MTGSRLPPSRGNEQGAHHQQHRACRLRHRGQTAAARAVIGAVVLLPNGVVVQIDLLVAAVVSDVLPNGNLVISGSQEVRVNFEMRVLNVAGIVRPVDISADNSIAYEKIAEARIAYGGRGRLMEVQQPPWGQQLVDNVSPF